MQVFDDTGDVLLEMSQDEELGDDIDAEISTIGSKAALIELYLDQVDDADLARAAKALHQCKQVTELYIGMGTDDTGDAPGLCAFLQAAAEALPLEVVHFNANILRRIKPAAALAGLLRSVGPRLRELHMPSGAFDLAEEPEAQNEVESALVACVAVRKIVVSGSNITKQSPSLMDAVGRLPSLRCLSVAGCTPSGPIVRAILGAADKLEVVQHTYNSLLSRGNAKGAAGSDAPFWKAIRACRRLKTVRWVAPLPADAEGQLALQEVVQYHREIETIEMGECDAEVDVELACCEAVANGLARNPGSRLRKLHLYCTVQKEDSMHIGRIISGGVYHLDVISRIPAGAVVAIAEGMKSPTCRLGALLLGGFSVDERASEAIGKAIAVSDRLRAIRLPTEAIGTEAMRLISEGIASSHSIETVEFDREDLDAGAYLHLFKNCRGCVSLKRLIGLDLEVGFGGGPETDTVAEAFAEMLEHNQSIEEVDGTTVTVGASSEVSERMVYALVANRGLRALSIRMADAHRDTVDAVCKIIASSPCLQVVRIGTDDAVQLHPLLNVIRNQAPDLRTIEFENDEFTDLQSECEMDRTHVIGWWMDDEPTAARAACALRMLGGPHASELDAGGVCHYAVRALRSAHGAEDYGACVVLASAIMDGMRGKKKGEEELVERWGRYLHDMGFLPAAVCFESGMWQACEAVARGRVGVRRGDERGEWSGAVIRCCEVVREVGKRRAGALAGWRMAVRANRDADMVFQAAAEGRPLELGRRLVLGVRGGGLSKKGRASAGGKEVGPLEAARMGGHDECVKLLEEAMG